MLLETEQDVLSFALRRVRRPEDAADLVADTYLVAWRRIDELPEGEEARLWIFGVARFQLANQQRGQNRRVKLADRLRAELSTGFATPDPADEISGEVLDALERLSDSDREVLTLHAWEGLEPNEIATVLGLRRVTARSRLHRARRRLRRELERGEIR